ncbi:chemotaxis protein CheB [Anaeromyxobacter sp. PSR-1]|uniref:chemotaxis protein CheB n=1 Tax=unclassified Anaeromyxobacter TaxID=2620896 RepID=UPI0005E06485|nr:chemotaxis protein CheB [Anaeromyxobacter sp. PSR-1]GAO01164.1 chemotaxis response regulator protein-glutamate methylesterase 3 [Anaeromyxobacter sp. PSR-1]
MTARPPTRVLVADDSPTLRRALRTLLEEDPGIRVVAEAADGAEAVALARTAGPDVVTMDVVMPGLDGLRATEEIMAVAPTRIIVVSQLAEREQSLAFQALAAGAVELLAKPQVGGPDDLRRWGVAVREAVRLMSEVPVVTRRALAGAAPARAAAPRALDAVGLAASTGGPQAVVAILAALPARLPLTLLVAQHIASGFVDGMRRWFAESTALEVRVAQDGEAPRAGCVYLAPPGRNLLWSRAGRLSTPPCASCVCPSGDDLLRSLAEALGPRAGGVVLSGMGEDGARGLLAIRRAGGLALAQSAATCVVNGMPGAAAALGAPEARAAPPEIAALLAAARPPADR